MDRMFINVIIVTVVTLQGLLLTSVILTKTTKIQRVVANDSGGIGARSVICFWAVRIGLECTSVTGLAITMWFFYSKGMPDAAGNVACWALLSGMCYIMLDEVRSRCLAQISISDRVPGIQVDSIRPGTSTVVECIFCPPALLALGQPSIFVDYCIEISPSGRRGYSPSSVLDALSVASTGHRQRIEQRKTPSCTPAVAHATSTSDAVLCGKNSC